jgi:alanine transaminase
MATANILFSPDTYTSTHFPSQKNLKYPINSITYRLFNRKCASQLHITSMLSHCLSHRFFASRLTVSDTSALLRRAEYAVLGIMDARSNELKAAIASGANLPFRRTIPCHIGSPYHVGKPVLTFPRQVLALAEYPAAADSHLFPEEAIARARFLTGGGRTSPILGIYAPTPGFEVIRRDVAKFLERRDGYPADFRRIFLSQGATSAILDFFRVVLTGRSDGLMLPVPIYPVYSAAVDLFDATPMPYDLIEDQKWGLDRASLQNSIQKARDAGVRPKVCVAVSPSNPTGTILSREDMEFIIGICEAEGIVLVADEVYQENVYADVPWQSFRKVAIEMKSKVQLMSINSISKGFFGECGHRGGYCEFMGIDDALIALYDKAVGISLPPNSAGQVLLDTLVNPPTGPICGRQWKEERDREVRSLEKRAKQLEGVMAGLPGMTPQPAMGAMYLFPKLHLPQRFISDVKNESWKGKRMEPDLVWCMKLLNEEGIVTIPGSGFGQKDGTYHVRMTFLPSEEHMTDVVERLAKFQTRFMNKYG